jgi:hypothetical protein
VKFVLCLTTIGVLALGAGSALGQVNRNPVPKKPNLPCHKGWSWKVCVNNNLRAGRSRGDAERWCDEGARRVAEGIPFTDCRAPSGASEWREIPKSFTYQGFRISEFTARATGSGCEGAQRYEKIDDPSRKGISARRWTSASEKDDGIVCTGGTWYFGGTNQPGGSEPDLLIKAGKFYRR